MPKGLNDIPVLRLSTLNKLVSKDMQPPKTFFSSLFPTKNYPSDTIEWEGIVGNLGMTPFVAPGAVAPALAPSGVSQHSARCAFWKEKMYMDEEFLNNLRQPGTRATYERAEMRLARELYKMKNRCLRRREWMNAQCLLNGTLSYLGTGGIKFSVDYDIQSTHQVTLGSTYKWGSGADRNILSDIYDAKETIQDDTNSEITHMIINDHSLRLMVEDPGLRTLLQKNAFGEGSFLVRPKMVLGSLFGIPNIVEYNEKYKVYAWLTAAVTASSTVNIYLDDVSDFVVGEELRLINMVTGAWEEQTISAVSIESGYVTVDTAFSVSFQAGRDRAVMTRKFVPDDTVLFFAQNVDGPILEFMQSPFGLDRHYGQKVDREEEWDPEGLWIRVQDKGMPVLYQRDATYKLVHGG